MSRDFQRTDQNLEQSVAKILQTSTVPRIRNVRMVQSGVGGVNWYRGQKGRWGYEPIKADNGKSNQIGMRFRTFTESFITLASNEF